MVSKAMNVKPLKVLRFSTDVSAYAPFCKRAVGALYTLARSNR